jgi:hypothetical protein
MYCFGTLFYNFYSYVCNQLQLSSHVAIAKTSVCVSIDYSSAMEYLDYLLLSIFKGTRLNPHCCFRFALENEERAGFLKELLL